MYQSQEPVAFWATVMSIVCVVAGVPGFIAYTGTVDASGSLLQPGVYG